MDAAGRARYRGEWLSPWPRLSFAAICGMALVSVCVHRAPSARDGGRCASDPLHPARMDRAHLAPQELRASAPVLFKVCMVPIGYNSTVMAGIFYLGWAAHLGEALFALWILRREHWLRFATAGPWFMSVCVACAAGVDAPPLTCPSLAGSSSAIPHWCACSRPRSVPTMRGEARWPHVAVARGGRLTRQASRPACIPSRPSRWSPYVPSGHAVTRKRYDAVVLPELGSRVRFYATPWMQ